MELKKWTSLTSTSKSKHPDGQEVKNGSRTMFIVFDPFLLLSIHAGVFSLVASA